MPAIGDVERRGRHDDGHFPKNLVKGIAWKNTQENSPILPSQSDTCDQHIADMIENSHTRVEWNAARYDGDDDAANNRLYSTRICELMTESSSVSEEEECGGRRTPRTVRDQWNRSFPVGHTLVPICFFPMRVRIRVRDEPVPLDGSWKTRHWPQYYH